MGAVSWDHRMGALAAGQLPDELTGSGDGLLHRSPDTCTCVLPAAPAPRPQQQQQQQRHQPPGGGRPRPPAPRGVVSAPLRALWHVAACCLPHVGPVHAHAVHACLRHAPQLLCPGQCMVALGPLLVTTVMHCSSAHSMCMPTIPTAKRAAQAQPCISRPRRHVLWGVWALPSQVALVRCRAWTLPQSAASTEALPLDESLAPTAAPAAVVPRSSRW
jgi:hypothetical protein